MALCSVVSDDYSSDCDVGMMIMYPAVVTLSSVVGGMMMVEMPTMVRSMVCHC